LEITCCPAVILRSAYDNHVVNYMCEHFCFEHFCILNVMSVFERTSGKLDFL